MITTKVQTQYGTAKLSKARPADNWRLVTADNVTWVITFGQNNLWCARRETDDEVVIVEKHITLGLTVESILGNHVG